MKDILDQKDYEKTVPIIEYLETKSSITAQTAKQIIVNSSATAWRLSSDRMFRLYKVKYTLDDGGVVMLGRIIGMVCCILCAFPFFIIGYYNKNSKEPIGFWSGDKNLKEKVKDVQGYNDEMSKLYIRCALVFVATGVICLIHIGVGICFILLECTFGIYVVWKTYKNILLKYS